MQQIADTKKHNIKFQQGDWVFLWLQPYRQHIVFKRVLQKLACRFYRSYQIEQRISVVAYKLKFP